MIRPIDIRLNAAHPDYPLAEAVTFTGSPSTVLVRGVPPNCGRWAITAVFVAATYPDGSTTTRAAVQSANGVWVATLPATARSGRTANGLRVLADGIDENGAAVTGYILGVADFAVASLGVAPAPEPGETSWQMLYFDAAPGVLRKGDVAKVDGVLKLYNGTAWEAFAAPPTLDNAVTRTSANGVKSSGIWSAIWGALAALPTGFTSLYDWCVAQLAGKASTADATLNLRGPNKDGFSAWTVTESGVVVEGAKVLWDEDIGWEINAPEWGSPDWCDNKDRNATRVEGVASGYVGTRTALQGYDLGAPDGLNAGKPLASEAEAEALRTGKQNALSAQQLANIAAVPNKADASAIPYNLVTKTISNNAVTLDDRASNSVTISATLSPNTLTINFPTAPTGKLRDFAMRLNIAAGVTAPEIAWPQGVTLENNGGEVPEIADGGTGGSSTILYFSESENNGTTAKVTVKGETLTAITQA